MDEKLRETKMRMIIEYALKHNVDYIYVLEDLLNILNGKDIKVTDKFLESYLD